MSESERSTMIDEIMKIFDELSPEQKTEFIIYVSAMLEEEN